MEGGGIDARAHGGTGTDIEIRRFGDVGQVRGGEMGRWDTEDGRLGDLPSNKH